MTCSHFSKGEWIQCQYKLPVLLGHSVSLLLKDTQLLNLDINYNPSIHTEMVCHTKQSIKEKYITVLILMQKLYKEWKRQDRNLFKTSFLWHIPNRLRIFSTISKFNSCSHLKYQLMGTWVVFANWHLSIPFLSFLFLSFFSFLFWVEGLGISILISLGNSLLLYPLSM